MNAVNGPTTPAEDLAKAEMFAGLDAETLGRLAEALVAGSPEPASGVAAGGYSNANLTVAADGRITAASNGTAGISDAPSDSTLYARQNGAWQHIAFSSLTGAVTYAQLPAEVQQVPISFPFSGKPASRFSCVKSAVEKE